MDPSIVESRLLEALGHHWWQSISGVLTSYDINYLRNRKNGEENDNTVAPFLYREILKESSDMNSINQTITSLPSYLCVAASSLLMKSFYF